MRIKLENVSYVYKPNTPFAHRALDNVSLEIPSGQFLAVIGATGSGKSTLIQHFNALLKPTTGKIMVGDVEITARGVDLKKVRQRVGLVFQYPEHQLFEETVYKDVAYGPINMGFSEIRVQQLVEEALARVNLDFSEVKERSPFTLSGGQKRRVALAGILAMQPEVLILDEPTASLDPRGRDEILNEIRKIHRETGITVVLVSHSMEEVARMADRILVMDRGKLVMDGTPREIFAGSEDLLAYGLDVPQVSRLLFQLESRGIKLPRDALTVQEAADAIVQYFNE